MINYRQGVSKQLQNSQIYSGDFIRLKQAEAGGYLCYDELSKNLKGN